MNICNTKSMIEKYNKAEKFYRSRRMIYKDEIKPIFNSKNNQFIYQNNLRDNKREFWLVNVNNKSKTIAFDTEKLVTSLEKLFNKEFKSEKLPINLTRFSENIISFSYENSEYSLDLENYDIKKIPIQEKSLDGLSPDGKYQVFTKDYNLFLKVIETGEIFQLTFDGEKNYDYATYLPSVSEMIKSGNENFLPDAEIFWDKSSKNFITFRIDSRSSIKNKRHMIQSCPTNGEKPKAYSYFYPVCGDKDIPMADQYVFDVETKTGIKIETSQIPLTSGWWPYHYICNYHEGSFYYQDYIRGWQNVTLKKIDYNTGKCTTVIEENSEICIDPMSHIIHVMKNSGEAIWSSMRDGFYNLYLYDIDRAELKNKITSEEFHVKIIVHCDEKNRIVYFIACGKEKDRNPYLDCLYKANFDGSNLTLLTQNKGNHKIIFSSDNSYFIDTYSLSDKAPIIEVRDLNGHKIQVLETADIKELKNTGWKAPEVFKVKARDNKTDIYGVIYRPTDFDQNKLYPVLQDVYSAPHHGPNFSFKVVYNSAAQSLAELGFIVIEMSGLGTNYRGKEFLKHSYKNVKDGGFPDYKFALEQLQERYSYFDLERVGVYGGSSGSFDTANAMLNHGDLYKVGVTSAGSYCNSTAGAWGQEIYLGYGDPEVYKRNSLFQDCFKLEGRLLLMQGELDETCNKESVMIFINELIKNNKDFDMLIIPNETHNFHSPYIIRKRWDYFVTHLLKKTPPKEFKFNE